MSNNLKKLRADAHLSQNQLARKLNTTSNSVHNWERNKATPSADAIYQMAKVFGVTTDDIFLALKTTYVVNNK